jgi:hypothetical protein
LIKLIKNQYTLYQKRRKKMKTMNKLIRTCFLCFLIVGFSLTQANAVPLGLGFPVDPYYLGHIDDGIPANPADEVAYIKSLITLTAGQGSTLIAPETYDRIGSTLIGPFSTVVETGADKDDTGGNIFDATGFEYILGKYDGPNDGSYVWYFSGGFTGSVELPTVHWVDVGGPDEQSYGLSHISGYHAVPVPAAIYLLGAGFVGLAGLRKKYKK